MTDEKLVIVGVDIPAIDVTELLNTSETKVSQAANTLATEHNTFVEAVEKTYSDNAQSLSKAAETIEKTFSKVVADLTGAMSKQFAATKAQVIEVAGITKELDKEVTAKAVILARVQKATENLKAVYEEKERALKAGVDVEIQKHKKIAIDSYMTEQGLEAVEAGIVASLKSKYDTLKKDFDADVEKARKEEVGKGITAMNAALKNQGAEHKSETAELSAENKSLMQRVAEQQIQITKLENEKVEMRSLENEKIKAMASGSSANVYVDSAKK